MLDRRSLHLKVQEMADCYKGTDYLREMCLVPKEEDQEAAALKWIALAILHGVNSNAKKITIRRSDSGGVTVQAEYRKTGLPSPGGEIGEKAIEVLRQITHFEKDKEKGPLAVGWGNESLELRVKLKRESGNEAVTLEFPK